MLLENADFFVRYKQLPTGIFAFVTPNDDGTFSIFLDPRRSREQQLADYSHEIDHIVHDDFYSDKPVVVIEREMQKM